MIETKSKKKLSYKEISKHIFSNKRFIVYVVISSIFLIGSVVISIFAPQILKSMTDFIYDGSANKNIDMNKVGNYTLILAILYVSNAILSYVANFLMTTFAYRYSQSLRKEIANKINKVPLRYFDNHLIGDLLSRLTNDVDQVGTSLQQSLSMLISSVFMLFGALIAMFATSWQMALTALISLPLMMVFIVILTKFAMPQMNKRQRDLGKVNSVVEENYNGQIVIELFNAQNKTNSKFEEKNMQLANSMFKAEIFGGLMQPITSFISYFAYAAVFTVGGLLMNANAGVSIGTITAFMMYVNLFQSPLTQIAQAINQLQLGLAASNRVFDFLTEKDEKDESSLERVFPIKDGKIDVKGEVEFKNVCFGYNQDREIIHNFNAKITPGMKVAIVGPTGAGKTTLVNLLMKFYDVTSGNILIDGYSIKDISRSEIRDIFGMVLQDTWIFSGSVEENIKYNTENITDEQLKEVCRETELDHYVKSLPNGFNYIINDANEISQGQRQLITIARAMLKNAPLMILDEATSNVDTRTEEVIQKAMDSLTSSRTSFVIAHRLSTIKNADLILVLKDGNIIEQGNHDQLMELNGFYASLYNSQFAFE